MKKTYQNNDNQITKKLKLELKDTFNLKKENIKEYLNFNSNLSLLKPLVFKKIDNLYDDYEDYNIFIDSIDFCDGLNGKIDYYGCNDNKPNLSLHDFCLNIPGNISNLIIRTTLEFCNATIRIHWLINLAKKNGSILSLVNSNHHSDNSDLNKYQVLILHNSIPNHYKMVSNNYNGLAPYVIYLYCAKTN